VHYYRRRLLVCESETLANIHEDGHVYQALAKTQKVINVPWLADVIANAARLDRAELSTPRLLSYRRANVHLATMLATVLANMLANMTSRALLLLPMRTQPNSVSSPTPALSSFNAMHAMFALTIFSAAAWRRAKAWLTSLYTTSICRRSVRKEPFLPH
jgi:hypothetical protein